MSDYKKLKAVELRQLAASRGLGTTGLRKAELIQLLCDNDAVVETVLGNDDGDHLSNGSESGSDSEQASMDGGSSFASGRDDLSDADDVTDRALNGKGSNATGPTDVLKLQLALAKQQARIAELELQKMKLSTKRRAKNEHYAEISIDPNIRGLLPRMSENPSQIGHFFHCFERTMQLHNVDKSVWTKYLIACLSQKSAQNICSFVAGAESRLRPNEGADFVQFQANCQSVSRAISNSAKV